MQWGVRGGVIRFVKLEIFGILHCGIECGWTWSLVRREWRQGSHQGRSGWLESQLWLRWRITADLRHSCHFQKLFHWVFFNGLREHLIVLRRDKRRRAKINKCQDINQQKQLCAITTMIDYGFASLTPQYCSSLKSRGGPALGSPALFLISLRSCSSCEMSMSSYWMLLLSRILIISACWDFTWEKHKFTFIFLD